MKMIIKVNRTTLICPAEETPRRTLWLSSLDLITRNAHTPNIYFYRNCGSSSGDDSFFNAETLKDALSQALVPFYPVAGRFKLVDGSNGRLEVDCNAKGVLFVEAEASCVIDDFGDFASSLEMRKLIPAVDYSAGISSFPLMVFQLTFFRCGGVSLGVVIHHHFIDGPAVLDFMTTWSRIARGIPINKAVNVTPFFDRTILKARNPPQPKFDHIELHPSPQPLVLQKKTSNKNNTSTTTNEIEATAFAVLNISTDQINILRLKSNSKSKSTSTFEILAAHIWQCVCKARMLDDDQPTKLYMMVNRRSRLSLPPGYFGNAIFCAALIRKAGHLISKPTPIVATEIHDVLVQANDNDYLRSAIDYLESQPDLKPFVRGAHSCSSPNLLMNTWTRIPLNTVDFGWGKPIFMGPVMTQPGVCIIFPSPLNDGSLSLTIGLESQHVMSLFTNHLYKIFSSY